MNAPRKPLSDAPTSISVAPSRQSSLTPRRKRGRRTLLWSALVVVLLAGTGIGVRLVRAKPTPIDPALIVVATRKPLEVEILETGRVQPREKVDLKSKVAGQVAKVNVSEGMHVKKGEILLVLDPVDYERALAKADADVAQARVALEYAKLLRERAKRGVDEGVASHGELDQRVHDERAKAMALRAAEVEKSMAQDNVRYSRLVAPIDGTVIARGIEPGEAVVPGVQSTFEGKPLLTVADLSELLVKINLNQIDVAKVQVGRNATLTLDALPGRTYRAVVTKVAPASVKLPGKDQEVFPIEARIEAPDDVLKPGMTADVHVHLDAKRDALVLPLEAVVKEGQKMIAHRIIENDKHETHTEKVDVKLGLRNDREVEILEGLEAGARVLLKPPSAAENETKL